MTPPKPPPPPLSSHQPLLRGILRGIEKEGLRVTASGTLAMTPHPVALGSALTHPHITTDYSEALLELITGTHDSVQAVVSELDAIHRFVARQLPDELIWNQSMPATLPPEQDIPIAWYGPSNAGMLKHVYRRGLAVRYGRTMQCIAGVHYNFSLPDGLWDLLEINASTDSQRKSRGYLALIRNFTRYAWLLMYLFGASPAVSGSFPLRPDHGLQPLSDDTWHLPYATSLRMSDLGYRNKAQSDLQLCYNDLDTFLQRMHKAVTTPWPDYQAIGTQRDGQWQQLNTNVLQIENEYYSIIRPKRTAGQGERPLTALARHGVQYVEVRCLDIDPFTPAGIDAQTCRFLDTFLLFCAVHESPMFDTSGFCSRSNDNFSRVVKQGREPGLQLNRNGAPVSLQEWANELLDQMASYAGLLDNAYGGSLHAQALQIQRDKVQDSELTPSARLLRQLRDSGASLHDFTLEQSRQHHATLLGQPEAAEAMARLRQQADASLVQQQAVEAADDTDFATYLQQHDALLQEFTPAAAT